MVNKQSSCLAVLTLTYEENKGKKKMCYSLQNYFTAFVFSCVMLSSHCVQQTQPNEDNLDKPFTKVNQTEIGSQNSVSMNVENVDCSSSTQCKDLKAACLDCKFNYTCVYGAKLNVTCSVKDIKIQCLGDREFKREMICRYCYQTDHWEHSCFQKANCNTVAAPKVYYRTNCSVKDEILCLGRRTFKKNLPCNWTGGYKWSTALIFSVTLGGFGADRFYLGHWQEGIGKLFSFGGLGVWTLIDVILISLRYLGPADGSLYI